MEFRYETAGPEGIAQLFGVNIFKYKWRKTGRVATVTDPKYGRQLRLSVYSAEIDGDTRLFAAGEIFAGIWIFFLPKEE